MKAELTQQEISHIRDMACEGMLTDGDHHKQWYLEQILDTVTKGGIQKALDSASAQGYNIERGIAP
jgi:hypothetical protein